MRLHTRAFKVAATAAIATSIAIAGTASAGPRWSGSDYCAVNNNGTWSLVGGGSCNPNQGKNASASWTEAYILDFDTRTIVDAATGDPVGSPFGSLEAMLIELSADYASHDDSGDWMYVGNQSPNQKTMVFLMIPESACSGNSDWALQPACED